MNITNAQLESAYHAGFVTGSDGLLGNHDDSYNDIRDNPDYMVVVESHISLAIGRCIRFELGE